MAAVGSLTIPVRGWHNWKLIACGWTQSGSASINNIGMNFNDPLTVNLVVCGAHSKYLVNVGQKGFVICSINQPLNEEVDLDATVTVTPVSGVITGLPRFISNDGTCQLPLPDIQWERDLDIQIIAQPDTVLSTIFLIISGERV